MYKWAVCRRQHVPGRGADEMAQVGRDFFVPVLQSVALVSQVLP